MRAKILSMFNSSAHDILTVCKKNTEKSFFIALKQQNVALFLLTNNIGKRKKLSADYNYFSLIFRTSVILSSVYKFDQMLKTYING